MTTITTIDTINATKNGRGRPVSQKTKKIRTQIINLLRRQNDAEMTTNRIAKAVKQSKARVVAQLLWLENNGVIAKAGTEKVTKGRGRPSAVWAVTEGTKVDAVKREYVQKMRAFVRRVSAMSFEERQAFVHENLKELNARQVEDEVVQKESIYRNFVGFTAYDAKRGMNDADKVELTMEDVNYWLTGRRLYKYAKQLGI